MGGPTRPSMTSFIGLEDNEIGNSNEPFICTKLSSFISVTGWRHGKHDIT